MKRPTPPALVLALAALAPALAAAPLDPTLKRRIAVEDEPLVFEVALPLGARLRGGRRVGDAGLSYRYSWRLLDAAGETLREAQQDTTSTEARWETAALVEPYQLDYAERLRVAVRVAYMATGSVVGVGRLRFEIPRVRDTTPPFARSMGDEEEYEDFEARPTTLRDGEVATTADLLIGPDGDEFSRSPFRAIVDDGDVVEGAGGTREERGTLGFAWKNLFDNLNPPFTGPDRKSIGRFGIYVRPQWDLSGSNPFVGDPGAPHLAARRVVVDEGRGRTAVLHLVDLTGALPLPPEEPGPWGEGEVRLPLPYDRVGDLEVGFYAEDTAWPAPNHARVLVARYRVVDDIAPVTLLSLRKVQGAEETWVTADVVNRRWVTSPTALGLPEDVPGEGEEELRPLAILARTPYAFHAMAFDNTRLDRNGLEVEVLGPPGVVGFGIRTERGGARKTTWTIPPGGLDPTLVRTPGGEPAMLFFGVPGTYRVLVRARDLHGNVRALEARLQVGDREFDRFRISEHAQRRGR